MRHVPELDRMRAEFAKQDPHPIHLPTTMTSLAGCLPPGSNVGEIPLGLRVGGFLLLISRLTSMRTCEEVVDWNTDPVTDCPNEGTVDVGDEWFCAEHAPKAAEIYERWLEWA